MDKIPQNTEVEKLILGRLMSNRFVMDELRDILSEDCFYDPIHKYIFKAIKTIDCRGESPDLFTVFSEIGKNKNSQVDPVYLSEISSTFVDQHYQHALYLVELSTRRRLIDIADKLRFSAIDESVDISDIISETDESVNSVLMESKDPVHSLDEAMKSVVSQMEANTRDDGGLTGTPTGLHQLDNKSGGLQKSDLIVIAADTSQGKTSLAVSMTINASLSGASIAFYSMEMKKEQIAARMMSVESGVPANQIMYSKLSSDQFDRIDRGIGKLYGKKVYFDDRSTSNIDTILASIRSLKMKYDIDGAVVDYLQILNVNMKGANKEAQMGDVSRRLKNLAKDLDIWIIALSQLNRDQLNPVPSLGRLRDSGQIAEAADMVILIYRPEIYGKYYPEPFQSASTKGTAMIDVAKGRNVGLLKFLCRFDPLTTKFSDMDEIPQFSAVEFDEQPF